MMSQVCNHDDVTENVFTKEATHRFFRSLVSAKQLKYTINCINAKAHSDITEKFDGETRGFDMMRAYLSSITMRQLMFSRGSTRVVLLLKSGIFIRESVGSTVTDSLCAYVNNNN